MTTESVEPGARDAARVRIAVDGLLEHALHGRRDLLVPGRSALRRAGAAGRSVCTNLSENMRRSKKL